jgi:LysM repeat protein
MHHLFSGLKGLGISFFLAFLVLGSFSLSMVENGLPPLLQPDQPALITPVSNILVVEGDTKAPTHTYTLTPTFQPPPAECPPPAGWVARLVQPGETLLAVARAQMTTVEALMRGNCLEDQAILPGSILYVPYLLATDTPTFLIPPVSSTPKKVAQDEASCERPSGWVIYVVRSGDTLYHIAMMSGTTVSALQKANCLGSSTTIHTGQQLWVPYLPPTFTPTRTVYQHPTTTPVRRVTSTPVPPTYTPVPPTHTPLPPTNTPRPPTDTPEPPPPTPIPPTETSQSAISGEQNGSRSNPRI